ncbi:hypothetical protein [Nonomuraea jabiensis]|uniref:Beta-lactamase-related domain-containing protein n=1 Tax=Nonomuraea jabiensis TaxID=882448 RepID=A0A7W9LFC0_9ACTN|nr:hypothetical protein [Nonomuraea jabiensis]MBB5781603.1 hypothetical protein [Nonomuraea jabiensis]
MPGPHAHGYASYNGKIVDATRMNPSLDSAYGHSGGTFGYLTYALRSDSGRMLVISANPYPGNAPADTLRQALTATFC